jgi:hypothetical protein
LTQIFDERRPHSVRGPGVVVHIHKTTLKVKVGGLQSKSIPGESERSYVKNKLKGKGLEVSIK